MRFLSEWQPERLRGSRKSTVELMRVRMVRGDSSSLVPVTSLNIENSASMKYIEPENKIDQPTNQSVWSNLRS